MSSGASVAQSTMHLPAPTPASTPPSISYTAFTASGVESITYTRSHAFTTSAGDASTVTASAASAFSASHLAAERFHTTSERPDLRRQRAMPSPMMPRPMKPTVPDDI